jgi:hypothetical protein
MDECFIYRECYAAAKIGHVIATFIGLNIGYLLYKLVKHLRSRT